MTPTEILSEIKSIISKMIEAGLSVQQNYPVLHSTGQRTVEVGISGAPTLSVSMRDAPYAEIYQILDESRAYHIKMIDGALLQICYRFNKSKLHAHRLSVFPAPHLESFDNDPAPYENDELYADIVGRNIVHVPIRFDYSAEARTHVDVTHPKSHLTLGQYPNCRIPVNAPLTPARFVKFVLRNFYSTAFLAAKLDRIDSSYQYEQTMTDAESKVTHLRC